MTSTSRDIELDIPFTFTDYVMTSLQSEGEETPVAVQKNLMGGEAKNTDTGEVAVAFHESVERHIGEHDLAGR